jgi:predicted patatin/cPLA2 family phospholipase
LPEQVVTTTADSGGGSLCAGPERAERDDDRDVIRFDLPSSGISAIRLSSTLPEISRPVVIDGYTEGGATCDTAE